MLTDKLNHFGVHGTNLKWFQFYLAERRQRVDITSLNNPVTASSSWEETEYGIPQGSILEPLLFIVYVNDLPRNIKNNSILVLFAVDTSALITSNNLNELQTKLVCTLTYMSEWFTANGLKLHIDKTNKMHFKLHFSSNSAFQISYCETNVKQAVHTKFLGFDLIT